MKSFAPLVLTLVLAAPFAQAQNWPQFRGANSQGVSEETGFPTSWSETENIAWKAEWPGNGHSSPIIWGDKLFLTSYSGYGVWIEDPGDPADLVRHLLCFDKNSGQLLWKKDIANQSPSVRPYEKAMIHAGYAAHTPVTDGEAIFCYFANHGTVAFDLDGNQLWQTEPHESFVPSSYGSGGSPVLFENLVITNASMEVEALIAYDKSSGEEVWRIEQFKQSYASPVLVKSGPEATMVINAGGYAWAFDPRTGEVRWKYENGRGGYNVPVALYEGGDSVIITSPNGGKPPIAALPIENSGIVKEATWAAKGRESATGSGMLRNGLVYNFDWLMTCHRADTGEQLWEERIKEVGGGNHGSMFATGDLIYLTDTDARTLIFKASPEFEIVGSARIQDADRTFIYASMAGSEGKLYLRTQNFLYCIGE